MIKYTYNASRNADEDQDEKKQAQQKKQPYHFFETTFCAQQIHFYLSTEIGESVDYTDMVHRILTASPTDTIYIHLNTPGGHLDTGIQIINAMQNSAAKIVTVLESMAFSLGTLIFLAGDEMIVNDHCMMMFHNFKGGIQGKGQELAAQLDATIKWFSVFAKKLYVPFLTEEEVDRILRGEDMWMHSPEIRKRLDRMIKTLSEQSTPQKKTKRTQSKRTQSKRSQVDLPTE